MTQENIPRHRAVSQIASDREAVLGHWIGGSLGRLLQLRGESRDDAHTGVKVESDWAAIGNRHAPVTIVRWREAPRADRVA
jgi:hypothetical protein